MTDTMSFYGKSIFPFLRHCLTLGVVHSVACCSLMEIFIQNWYHTLRGQTKFKWFLIRKHETLRKCFLHSHVECLLCSIDNFHYISKPGLYTLERTITDTVFAKWRKRRGKLPTITHYIKILIDAKCWFDKYPCRAPKQSTICFNIHNK